MKYRVVKKDGKTIVFGSRRRVLIFCRKIQRCGENCPLYSEYLKNGYDTACVNPSVYGFKRENIEKIFRYVDGEYEEEDL